MGFLDKFKGHAEGLKNKATDLASEHGDKIDSGIDKVAKKASDATGGKFDDKIDMASEKAKEGIDKLDNTN